MYEGTELEEYMAEIREQVYSRCIERQPTNVYVRWNTCWSLLSRRLKPWTSGIAIQSRRARE